MPISLSDSGSKFELFERAQNGRNNRARCIDISSIFTMQDDVFLL